MNFVYERPIAHRGLHNSEVPENSMEAFALAIENNYAIELDVHLSKDKVPVVFHDEDLERMTGSRGNISQYVLKSLKKLNLKDTENDIPTLQEVLDLVAGKVPLIIEIKGHENDGEIEARVMSLLEHYQGDYTIQSFNPLSLRWVREKYPNTVLGLLVTNDFSDTKLGIMKKIMLQYMTFTPVIRPDYIGLDYETFNIAQYYLIKMLTFGKIVFWTISSEEMYEECKEFADNIIFEGFRP